MDKYIAVIGIAGLLFVAGCKEEMVGAPCIPETDNGAFNVDIAGQSWSIETGSVQCATRICLTQVGRNPRTNDGQIADCKANPSLEACWGEEEQASDLPVQLKFSFCSCRCRDPQGNTYNTNPDKYDYLCECPPSTICEDVMEPIEGVSDKLPGGYCIPNCIANPCESTEEGVEICTPSKNSEEPWKWYCAAVPGGL